MFILRKITSDGEEMVFNLGEGYTLLTFDKPPKQYQERLEKMK